MIQMTKFFGNWVIPEHTEVNPDTTNLVTPMIVVAQYTEYICLSIT